MEPGTALPRTGALLERLGGPCLLLELAARAVLATSSDATRLPPALGANLPVPVGVAFAERERLGAPVSRGETATSCSEIRAGGAKQCGSNTELRPAPGAL